MGDIYWGAIGGAGGGRALLNQAVEGCLEAGVSEEICASAGVREAVGNLVVDTLVMGL